MKRHDKVVKMCIEYLLLIAIFLHGNCLASPSDCTTHAEQHPARAATAAEVINECVRLTDVHAAWAAAAATGARAQPARSPATPTPGALGLDQSRAHTLFTPMNATTLNVRR